MEELIESRRRLEETLDTKIISFAYPYGSVDDRVKSMTLKAGFSYGLHTDIFAIKNISFNSAMMWSKINGLPVNSFELRGKYHKKNYWAHSKSNSWSRRGADTSIRSRRLSYRLSKSIHTTRATTC